MSRYTVLFDGNDGPAIMVKGLGQYIKQSFHNEVVEGANDEFAKKNAEIDQLKARVAELEEAIKCTIDPENEPEYHDEGMGCGLEDRNITCRYEAMAYGWEKAIGRIYSEVMPPEDILG